MPGTILDAFTGLITGLISSNTHNNFVKYSSKFIEEKLFRVWLVGSRSHS